MKKSDSKARAKLKTAAPLPFADACPKCGSVAKIAAYRRAGWSHYDAQCSSKKCPVRFGWSTLGVWNALPRPLSGKQAEKTLLEVTVLETDDPNKRLVFSIQIPAAVSASMCEVMAAGLMFERDYIPGTKYIWAVKSERV